MFKSIVYGPDYRNTLDLVLPKNRSVENTPLIVFIHGGAWVLGNKDYFRREIRQFADSGFACASINYRFVSNEKNIHHKEITSDVLLALDYLRAHAKIWNISPDRIGLIGHSAGGQLAMIIAYTQNADRRIKAVVSWAGPANFLDYAQIAGGKKPNVFTIYTGTEAKTKADTLLWKQASPFWMVQSTSVPTLLVQGDHDPLVPARHAEEMKVKLDSLGVVNKLLMLPYTGHIYVGKSWRVAKDATYSWLKERL